MERAERTCPVRKRSRLVGHSEPRIHTPPLRPLTEETSLGYSLIEFAEMIDVPLLPWQQALAIRALELHPTEDRLRFRTVLLLVARQNGKSTIAQLLTLWAMFVLEVALVVGTAQVLAIAEELWQSCVDLVEADPELSGMIERVVKVNGKKALELASGSRYIVAAANRKTARGLSVDLLLLDELREHTNHAAWSAATKTTMARPKAQIWCMSNAGDLTSVVLLSLRLLAHAALGDPDKFCEEWGDEKDSAEESVPAESLGIFEWSAAPHRSIWDEEGWREANPSLGYLIDESSLKSAAETDPEATFQTENLCQWVRTMEVGAFGPDAWEACRDSVGEIPDEAPITYAVDVSVDRRAAAIAVAGQRADGRYQVEIAAYSAVGGWSRWVPAWFEEFVDAENPVRVVVPSKNGPAAALVEVLQEIDGLTVVEWSGASVMIGCGALYDRVMASIEEGADLLPLAHRGQEVLDLAAKTAAKKHFGDGWYWSRANSSNDAAPLVAASAALWDLLTNTPAPRADIYGDGYRIF